MNDYYKTELLMMIEDWSDEKLLTYIHELEERLENTRIFIRALKALKKRKNRNKSPKETGTRGGI